MDATGSPTAESGSSQTASFGRLLPLVVFHSIINAYGTHSFTHPFLFANTVHPLALIPLLTTPFWCHLSDMKGRRFTIMISLLGTSLCYGIAVFPLPPSTSFLALSIIRGLTGGYATYQSAILSYIVDVSSSKDLLPNLCISLAIELLNLLLVSFIQWKYAALVGFAVAILLCLYAYILLGESLPRRISLPPDTEVQPSVQHEPYKTWIGSMSEMFKQKPRAFRLAFIAAVIIFTVVPFADYSILWRTIGHKIRIIICPIGFWDGPFVIYILPYGSRVLILLVFASVLKILPRDINPAEVAKFIVLGATANIVICKILATVDKIAFGPLLSILLVILHTISSPIMPALTVLLYFLWDGDVEYRGSFIGVLVLLQVVLGTAGSNLGIVIGGVPLSISALVTSILGLFAFIALIFVQIPPCEEFEEEQSPEISPNSPQQ